MTDDVIGQDESK